MCADNPQAIFQLKCNTVFYETFHYAEDSQGFSTKFRKVVVDLAKSDCLTFLTFALSTWIAR